MADEEEVKDTPPAGLALDDSDDEDKEPQMSQEQKDAILMEAVKSNDLPKVLEYLDLQA